jgi:hypothetical protein
MAKALFRFYEELNDALPPGKRKRDFEVPLEGRKTAREIIEKLEVRPEAVDLLLVKGQSLDLDYVVHDGDRISVYPVFERLNIQGVSRIREKPLRRLRFIVDSDLKALAQSLEGLGVDVCFRGGLCREQILQVAKKEHRIFLTLQSHLQGSQELDRLIVLKPGPLHKLVSQVMHALDLTDERGQEREHEGKRKREVSEDRKGLVD